MKARDERGEEREAWETRKIGEREGGEERKRDRRVGGNEV